MKDLFGNDLPETNGWQAAFSEFKSFYPRRQAWAKAEKTFRRMFTDHELPSLAILREAISIQIRHGCLQPIQAADGRDTRPLPASWLNGKRWMDECQTPTSRRELDIQEIEWALSRGNLTDDVREVLQRKLEMLRSSP